jgi:hypothetical protein
MSQSVRVVFLDFDGVLNSTAYAMKSGHGGVLGLDPEAGARLERLVQRGRADVVVSSTWRLGRTRAELCDLLHSIGYTGRVLGKTPDLNCIRIGTHVPRGAEIEMWMKENARRFHVTSFVILDDDSDMAPHHTRLVRTNFDVGLTNADVERALSILEVPVREPEGAS